MTELKKFLLYLVVLVALAALALYLLGSKPREFVFEREYSAPPATVFKFLTEPALRQEWTTHLTRCELGVDGLKEGGDYQSTFSLNAGEIAEPAGTTDTTESILLLKTDELLTLRRNVRGIVTTEVFQLTPLSNDRTRLNMRVAEYREWLPSILYLLDKRNVEQTQLADLESLERALTRVASAAASEEPAAAGK